MKKQLSAIFYNNQCVGNFALSPEATDEEIRRKALDDHAALPLCDIGELPGDRRSKLIHGEIRRYNTVETEETSAQEVALAGLVSKYPPASGVGILTYLLACIKFGEPDAAAWAAKPNDVAQFWHAGYNKWVRHY